MKRTSTLLVIMSLLLITINPLLAQAQWQRLYLNAGHEDYDHYFDIYSGNYFDYYGVCCVTENMLYVCGQSGIILKSINSGYNWSLKHFNETETIWSIDFYDKRIGYAGGVKTVDGTQHNILLKTIDYGNTWEEFPTTIFFNYDIEDTGGKPKIMVISPDTIFVYNKYAVYRSTDSGYTFETCYSSDYNDYHCCPVKTDQKFFEIIEN